MKSFYRLKKLVLNGGLILVFKHSVIAFVSIIEITQGSSVLIWKEEEELNIDLKDLPLLSKWEH